MTYSRTPRSEHTAAAEALYRLLDGDYTGEEEARVLRNRVAECPDCWESLSIEEEIRRLVRTCCCSEAPARLRETIVFKMRVEWTIG